MNKKKKKNKKKARGEHADARELASLYISKGVPIYPTPHGHAYHTVAWRMGLELNIMNNEEEDENEEGNGTPAGGENAPPQAIVRENDEPLNPEAILGEALGNGIIAPNNNNNEGNNVRVPPPPPPPPRSNNNVEEEGDDDNNNVNTNTDAFYTHRYVEEAQDEHTTGRSDSFLFSRNHATYVEEKALFCTFLFFFCCYAFSCFCNFSPIVYLTFLLCAYIFFLLSFVFFFCRETKERN